ncbi:MAG TPA: hypothetical protein DD379_12510 [Cyanobacteria bacterium UBA11162]|nr:hypothetical protein [Cyanobacteria bacterium UBA11162]
MLSKLIGGLSTVNRHSFSVQLNLIFSNSRQSYNSGGQLGGYFQPLFYQVIRNLSIEQFLNPNLISNINNTSFKSKVIMGVKMMKLFTGMMLSLAFCGVAGYAAIAEPMNQQTQRQDMNPMNGAQVMRGRITSITGSVATVRMANGERDTIGISRLQNLQLVPGTPVLIQDGRIMEYGRMALGPNQSAYSQFNYSMNQTQPMRGQITSITGSVATVQMENGQTETVGISRLQHSALVPGTEVLIQNGRIIEMSSEMDSTNNEAFNETNRRTFNQRSTTDEMMNTPNNQGQPMTSPNQMQQPNMQQ